MLQDTPLDYHKSLADYPRIIHTKPNAAPHLGSSIFFLLFIFLSAESCIAGPVNISKWCLKYVPRATLSNLHFLVPYFFVKEDVGDGSVLTTVLQFFTIIIEK